MAINVSEAVAMILSTLNGDQVEVDPVTSGGSGPKVYTVAMTNVVSAVVSVQDGDSIHKYDLTDQILQNLVVTEQIAPKACLNATTGELIESVPEGLTYSVQSGILAGSKGGEMYIPLWNVEDNIPSFTFSGYEFTPSDLYTSRPKVHLDFQLFSSSREFIGNVMFVQPTTALLSNEHQVTAVGDKFQLSVRIREFTLYLVATSLIVTV